MKRPFGTPVRTILLALILYALSFAGWSEPVRISEPGGCVYPQILAQGDTLHVVYTNASGGYYAGYVRSTDAGDTWSEPVILCDTIETELAEFVRIIPFEEVIIVIWRNIAAHGNYRFNLGYAISYDNGETWENPRLIISENWDHMLYYAATGSDSVISIIFSRSVSPDLVFYNVRSTDFGESWSEPTELFRAVYSGQPDMAGHGNLIHFVWAGRFSTEEKAEIYYMKSSDAGITWSSNMPISDIDEFHSQLPAIAADESENVGITWMDFKYAPPGVTGDVFLRLSTDSGSTWSVESQLTCDHKAFRSDLRLDSDTIQVVWEDATLGMAARYIDYIKSTDNGASWTEPCWVDRTEDDSWNPAMDISNGKVYVVWVDAGYVSGMGVYFSKYENQTDVNDDIASLPNRTVLVAYPNPFNSITTISYANLPSGAIAIYNVAGQKVATLPAAAAEGQVTWDGTDATGSAVSSGIYFVRAAGGTGAQTIKLVYLK